MDCPDCGAATVAFRAPPELREYVPDDDGPDGEYAAICPDCLRLESTTEAPSTPDFSAILDSFPDGEAGSATALGVGLLVDSLALNRGAVAACFEYAGDRGVDPWLVLERLAAAGSVQPDADLDRARTQLEQLLD